jgi:hypothetical protein
MVAAAVFIGLVAIVGTVSPYWSYYPLIPWAALTLDGRPAEELAAYYGRSGRVFVVTRGRTPGREIYFVNFGDPKSAKDDFRRDRVESCPESSIFVYRLLAIRNHEQMCRPFAVLDSDKPEGQPKRNERNLVVAHRSVEFSADDGRRLHVSW